MIKDIQFSLPDPLVWYESAHYRHSSRNAWHSHPDWQLTVSLEGRLSFTFEDGRTQVVKAGQVILLPPGVPHHSSHLSRKGWYGQLFFHRFSEESFPEPARCFSFPTENCFVATLDKPQVVDLVETIRARCQPTDPLFLSWRMTLCNAFLMHGAARIVEECKPVRSMVPKAVPKALDYLERHYRKDLSVQDMAAHVELSVSRFSALFQSTTGTSPLQYLNQLRLSKAQTLLLRGSTVKETAEQSGFRSVEYFCRFFKKKIGKTPSEFKEAPFQ